MNTTVLKFFHSYTLIFICILGSCFCQITSLERSLQSVSEHNGTVENYEKNSPKGTTHMIKSNNAQDIDINSNEPNIMRNREYAFVLTTRGANRVFGAKALLDVWNPLVSNSNDYSLSMVSIVYGYGTRQHTSVEAGWIVHGSLTRTFVAPIFFIRWTRDGYRTTGCFDLDCPGFVHLSDIPIGGVLPIDENMSIMIRQDRYGDWWLFKDGDSVGYWNSTIVGTPRTGAEMAIFGGEVTNSQGQHCTTQMGNGHTGVDGIMMHFLKTSQHLGGKLSKIHEYEIDMSTPRCYNVMVRNPNRMGGISFYYGGPGHNNHLRG